MRVIGIALSFAIVGIAGCNGGGGKNQHDASSAEVAVVTTGSLAPIPGARVVVHRADGTPLDILVTGSDGLAVIDDPAVGTMVTIVTTAGGDAWLRTIASIEAGDELLVPIPGGGAVPTPTPVATPDFAFSSDYPGAFGFALELGCSVDIVLATSGSAQVGQDCISTNGSYDAVALAADAGINPLAFSVLEDVATSETSLQFPAWRTDFMSVTLEVTGAPPGVHDLFGSVLTRADRGAFGTGDTAVNSTGGTGSFVIRLIPEPAVGTVTGLDFSYGTGMPADGRGLHFVGESVVTAAQSLDLGDVALPRVSEVTFVSGTSASIAWTSTRTLDGDVLQVSSAWVTGSDLTEWILYAPAETASPLALPVLPPEIRSLVPMTEASSVRVRFVDADFIHGYGAFRNDYLAWMPTGSITLTSTAALQAIPLGQIPVTFVLDLSEAEF